MREKLGNFFILAGVLALILFIAAPSWGWDYLYFCFGGTSLVALGGLLLRGARRSRSSSRFRFLKWLLGGRHRQDEEEEG